MPKQLDEIAHLSTVDRCANDDAAERLLKTGGTGSGEATRRRRLVRLQSAAFGLTMPRPEIDTLIDLSQPEMNRRLRSKIAMCEGIYDVKIKPKRSTRSSKANAYYWAAVVTPFYEFLREQEPLLIKSKDQAHIELKRQVLGTAEVKIGKAKMRAVPTTRDMDVKAFMDYVERARFFLSEMVGLETLDPGEFGVANVREAINQ